MPGDAAHRAAYLATTWSVRAAGGTIRLALGRPAPAALRPAAIVTACNPASEPAPVRENRAAARALAARAAALGIPALPARAHGTGPERLRWSEPGLALLGPAARDAAVRLARDFGQNAVVCADAAGAVVLVATRPGFCGLGVGEVIPS